MKFILLILIFCFSGTLWAEKAQENNDVVIHANDMQTDDTNNIITAKEDVVVSNGVQILEADEVIYNKNLKVFKATGNVKVFDIDGNKIYAKYAEVTDKFEFGFMQNGKITTSDKEFIAATKARREEGSVYYTQGVYSPCLVCHECKDYDPLWQIKASKIHHDRDKKEVHYRNARMEFKGVPVFYTPYFKHPDPSIKRKTGVLTPSLGTTMNLGFFAGLPVYIALNESSDITVTPYYYSKQNPVISAEYRQNFRKASLNLGGSLTRIKPIEGAPGQEVMKPGRHHGHYFGDLKWHINENWRLNAFYVRATNPTYLRRYSMVGGEKYVHKNVLTSTFDAEYFNRTDYMAFKGYHFQNMRADIDNKTVPDVLPVSEFSFERPTNFYGSYFLLNANTMSVTRDLGTQVNRATGDLFWIIPYTNKLGMAFEGLANIRSDVFDIKKHTVPGKQEKVNQVRGRFLPGSMVTWRWPFYSKLYSAKVILEPIISGILQPNDTGSKVIPNEDSQDFELDTQTLFKLNRFNGYDLLDAGQRVNYGLNLRVSTVNGVKTQVFFGQSYNFSKVTNFPESTGVNKKGSDYIGSIRVVPGDYFYLDWALRLDKDSGSVKRSIVKLSGGPKQFRVDVDHYYLDHSFIEGQFGAKEQVSAQLSSNFVDHWSAYLKGLRQIKPSAQRLQESIGLVYSDECFNVTIEGAQTHFKDRDIKPEKTILLTFGFKNLGEVSTGRINNFSDSSGIKK